MRNGKKEGKEGNKRKKSPPWPGMQFPPQAGWDHQELYIIPIFSVQWTELRRMIQIKEDDSGS